ncbi:hypothetical protein WR25_25496 [Diploscapter pachys]|uniref:Protein kinase domain-containing protein n=1 Tax=Diploscapter pachys TaxID=2018661 RepID=A0A2A2LUH1_9BILA|nr:hypothetical protein WR25_25496 [Diploscapter pachys]
MKKIEHPNCMRFYDLVQTEDRAFIVMELIAGGELFDRIVDPKYDSNPENILCVGKDDYTVVKLTDFGLAKSRSVKKTMKTHCGTPTYIAPEMIDNDNTPYTDKVDIWSLGVVLFTAIVGYPPFSSDYGDMELNDQIKKGEHFDENNQHVSRPSAHSLFNSEWMQCEVSNAARLTVQNYVKKSGESTDTEMGFTIE